MEKRPNILLITTDQQRADTVAALGNPIIRTPTLDCLVREGTAFTRCVTPSPVCVPARHALVTGLTPHGSGCFDNDTINKTMGAFPSLMERLDNLGYRTHGVGKMHFEPDLWANWGFDSRDTSEEIQPIDSEQDDYCRFLREHGYAHVEEPHGVRSEMYYLPQPSQLPAALHNTAWVADRALSFLETRDSAQPFFLWASFIKPHPPFEVPTPWNKLYRTAEMTPAFRPEGFERLLTYWNHFQNRYKYRGSGRDEGLERTLRAAYYGCISFIDYHIGRMLDGLGNDLEDTLVLFTSDHGELLGDYGSYGKRSMLSASVQVPMLARYPKAFRAGARCDTPTTLLDIWPTCLALAGEPQTDSGKEGRNLEDIAAGRAEREAVFSQFSHGSKGLYMVMTGELKYIYSAADNRAWLFDLERDPQESHNFVGNPLYEEREKALRDRLIGRFQRDGYLEPLDGGDWAVYPPSRVPEDKDSGLLFQDPPTVARRLSELGAYAEQDA